MLSCQLPGVEAINTEVGINTEAVVSCVISGITKTVISVNWTDDTNNQLTSDTINYVITVGAYSDGTNSLTTSLTVTNGVNTDSTFSCVVASNEWRLSNYTAEVALNVFGE